MVLLEVARVVEILERLTDQRLLFTMPRRSGSVPASNITRLINEFAAHVNTLADCRHR